MLIYICLFSISFSTFALFSILCIIWNRACIFLLLKILRNIHALCQVKWKEERMKRKRRGERERVNQIAGDVRLWRRTNSIHLGAREYIRWHNRNIRNHKSLSLSPSFFYMLSQAVFYDSLDSLLLVQIIANLLSSVRVQLYSVVNIFLLFTHQVVFWPS
jgi:hypothetical protein